MKLKPTLAVAAAFLMISAQDAYATNTIDNIVNARLRSENVTASDCCDDARLARRYFLVLTDRIPTETQVKAFLAHNDRAALVDSLLASDGFVRKQVLKWGDLMRIKSEFPSCMWPNAVQAFNKWLTEEFRANTPYNEFVAHILKSSGSNFRVPPTNFYRAGNDRSGAKYCSDIALLFLGRREYPKEWESFFCQIKFKSTKEWKEEILCLDIDAKPARHAVRLSIQGKEPQTIYLRPGSDFRIPFIDYLTSKDNSELARAYVNRLWFWMTGFALIDPVDDIEGKQASCPELLDYLTKRFVESGFDTRALAREILLSDTFCRSSIIPAGAESADRGFSHFVQTRLSAEQICDAICDISGVYDKYSSRAPEPFTNFPEGTHYNEVSDGTITTSQLDVFGRPSRDVSLESSRDNSINSKQILYLLNSTDIQSKLKSSPILKQLSNLRDIETVIRSIYLRVLSRPAEHSEISAVTEWMESNDISLREMAEDLTWALLNTDEFLFMN